VTRLGEALKRLADALLRIRDRPALPPDAERELAMWTAEDIARYKAEHGGIAPPDAPTIDEGGI
jgi:hypothetical protein